MKWNDISSYSKNDQDSTPKTWESRFGGLNVVVTRHRHCAPDEWVLTCVPWFNTYGFAKGQPADEAKAIAARLVREKLEQALAGMYGTGGAYRVEITDAACRRSG